MSFEVNPIQPDDVEIEAVRNSIVKLGFGLALLNDVKIEAVRNSIVKPGFGLALLNLSLRMTSNPGLAIYSLSQVINEFGMPEKIVMKDRMGPVELIYQSASESSNGISYIRGETLTDGGNFYGSVPFVEMVNKKAGHKYNPEHIFESLDFATKENMSRFPINIVLMLRYIQGLNGDESAYLLGTTRGNVGVLLSRGMDTLIESL